MKSPERNILYPRGVHAFLKDALHEPRFDLGNRGTLPRVLLYTSRRVPGTDPGSKIRLQRAGEILNVWANVQEAPSTTLTWDILKNGVSVFATKPTISAGSETGNPTPFIENALLVESDYLQVQITARGGATFPLHAWIEWVPMEVY